MSRRMFSHTIVESDAFLDMPISTQALYFHLGMNADDDGFVSPKRIMRMLGASDDDLKVLSSKRFVLPFENGVVVIKHWRINNLMRWDWYKPTQYLDQRSSLFLKENGSYTEDNRQGQPFVNEPLPKLATVRPRKLSKVKLSKVYDTGGTLPLKTEIKTPSDEAKDFFEGKSVYQDLLTLFSKDKDQSYIDGEFKKFSLYWTELNKSGSKQRWEQQPTFEVKRRLFTWLNRSNSFTSKQIKQRIVL